jgi:hypothetical protein
MLRVQLRQLFDRASLILRRVLPVALVAVVLVAGILTWWHWSRKDYLFSLAGAVEYVRVRVKNPTTSVIALLNARPMSERGLGKPVTGELRVNVETDVEIERRGDGPVRIVLRNVAKEGNHSIGRLEERVRDGRTKRRASEVDVSQETAYRIDLSARHDSSTVVESKAGSFTASLDGKFDIGDEGSAVALTASRLQPGGHGRIGGIKVEIYGGSVWLSPGQFHHLGAFDLPPQMRLSSSINQDLPQTTRQRKGGAKAVNSVAISPGGDGGLIVEATSSARELFLFGPPSGDTPYRLKAGILAVLLGDPDVTVVWLLIVALITTVHLLIGIYKDLAPPSASKTESTVRPK